MWDVSSLRQKGGGTGRVVGTPGLPSSEGAVSRAHEFGASLGRLESSAAGATTPEAGRLRPPGGGWNAGVHAREPRRSLNVPLVEIGVLGIAVLAAELAPPT